jgi:ankyrin repeat protein
MPHWRDPHLSALEVAIKNGKEANDAISQVPATQLDFISEDGHTLLTRAARHDNVRAVRALLDRGASPEVRCSPPGWPIRSTATPGLAALGIAGRCGHARCVLVLIEGNAKVQAADLWIACKYGHSTFPL